MVLEDGTVVIEKRPLSGVPFYSDWLRFLLMVGQAKQVDEKIVPHDATVGQGFEMDSQGNVGLLCVGCGVTMWNELHAGFRGGRKQLVGKGMQSYMITKTPTVHLDHIRIGAYVQFKQEQLTAPKELLISWHRRPVSKTGIGCHDCRLKFGEAVALSAVQAESIATYDQFTALVVASHKPTPVNLQEISRKRCQHGIPESFCGTCIKLGKAKGITKDPGAVRPSDLGIKRPKELVPFIDVFEDYQLVGKLRESHR